MWEEREAGCGSAQGPERFLGRVSDYSRLATRVDNEKASRPSHQPVTLKQQRHTAARAVCDEF